MQHSQTGIPACRPNEPTKTSWCAVLTELVSKFRSTTATGNRRAGPVKVPSALFTIRASERPPRLALHISAAFLMISSISTQGSGPASSFCQLYGMVDLESEPCLAAAVEDYSRDQLCKTRVDLNYIAKHVIAIGINRERSKALTTSFSTWNLLTAIVLRLNVRDEIITRSRQVVHSF